MVSTKGGVEIKGGEEDLLAGSQHAFDAQGQEKKKSNKDWDKVVLQEGFHVGK